MFPSYRNQSETGFYMMGTLAVKALKEEMKGENENKIEFWDI